MHLAAGPHLELTALPKPLTKIRGLIAKERRGEGKEWKLSLYKGF